MSHFAFAGGILLLLLGTFKVSVLRASHKHGDKVEAATVKSGVVTKLTQESVARHQLPKHFLIFYSGVTSIVFSEALVASPLGTVICAGLACYLSLAVWLLTTKKDNPRPLLAIDTLLNLAPAICYAIAAAAWFVI
jgi:hypothetical protein